MTIESGIELSSELKEAQERIKAARAAIEQANRVEETTSETPTLVTTSVEQEPAVAEKQDSVQVADPTSSEIEKLRKDMANLNREMSRRSGEYGSELDRLRKSLQVTSDQNTMLMKQLETLNSKKSKKLSDDDDKKEEWEVRRAKYLKDVTEDERSEYEDKSINVMAKISERASKENIKKLVPKIVEEIMATNKQPVEVLPEIQKKIEQIEQSAGQSEFLNAVESMAPGFIKANGNTYTGTPADENWIKFLESPKDDFETWRQYCERIGGPKVAAITFAAYQSSNKKSVNKPSLEGQTSPAKSNASGPVPNGQRVFTVADYERFKADVQRGVYQDDPQEALRKFSEYKTAIMEGRLH